jgi:PAS domain-containing protein
MSARLLEHFAQISCDWFWEMDDQLKFSYFTSRWTEVFGRPPEQEIGKSRLDVAMNSQDRAFWQPHLDDLHARRRFAI